MRGDDRDDARERLSGDHVRRAVRRQVTAAAELASALREKGIRVTVVDEPSLHLHRNAGYANGHVQRGLLKATVDRSLHRDGPVGIVDACGNIKGYRYELWCIAKRAPGRASCTAIPRKKTRAPGTKRVGGRA